MDIKNVISYIFVAVCAYLQPISGILQALAVIFALNFFFGLISDHLHGKPFELKKAFRCVVEATLFCLLVCCVYFIGERSNASTGGIWFVSYVSYALYYFYGCNILRNLKNILKEGSTAYAVVCFLYYLLTFEFVKHVPYLEDYIKKCDDGKD